MKLSILLLFAVVFFNCSSDNDSFFTIVDSTYFYNDTIMNPDGKDIIYLSPYQRERESEMPFSLELLKAFSYYRSNIPSDYVKFPAPEYLYYYIPDTLHDRHYTYYVSQNYVSSYLDGFEMESAKFFGISVTSNNDTLFISSVYENSAADSAGLKRGDKIVAVDNFDLHGNVSVYNAVVQDNSKEYSFVIVKDSTSFDTINVSKKEMTVPASYADSISPTIGYIKLTSFIADSATIGGSTSHQFHESLKETAKFKVTIIDLRGNGGGYINQAYYCSYFFLNKGDSLIKITSWNPDFSKETITGSMDTEIITSNEIGEYANRKFVFLVDGGTASASEILLSAIRYNTDFPIVGVKTYGKGIGQTSVPALNGAMAHITRLRIFMPDGTNYHQIGIIPDYIIDGGFENFKDKQLSKAIELANGLSGNDLGKTMNTNSSYYNEFEDSKKNYIDFPGLGFGDSKEIEKFVE